MKYVEEALKIEDAYNSSMLKLARRFEQEYIMPLCKRHGLIGLHCGSGMGGTTSVEFIGPGGREYELHSTGSVVCYGLNSVTVVDSDDLRKDLSEAFEIIDKAGLKKYLRDFSVKLVHIDA